MQRPGPPGRPGLSGQQESPSSQFPCTPPLQRQPWLVHGDDGGPMGLQPTEDGVQVPGPPGGPLGSFAQQSNVLSPQGSWVPVVHAQPTPGRDGSVQTSCALAPGCSRCAPTIPNTVAARPTPPCRTAERRDRRAENALASVSKRFASKTYLLWS